MLAQASLEPPGTVRRSGNICRSGDGGLGEAAVMLVVVLATNLLLVRQ
jgi:hypothetical protein